MNTAEWIKALRLSGLSADQLRAIAYLERQGQQFCVEFGYANAVEKARTHWRERRNRLQRMRRSKRTTR